MIFMPLFGKITILSLYLVNFRVSRFHVSHLTHETFKLRLQNTLNMSKTIRVYFGVLQSAKGDIPVGLWVVVLLSQSTSRSSSTHLPLTESNRFFKAVNRVLLEAFAWPLLCGYRRVEYRFFIFNSWQKFLYAQLSN